MGDYRAQMTKESGQDFTAWFVTYPRTHRRAGQAVEVVTREVFDRLCDQHAGAVAALHRIAEEEHLHEGAWARTVAREALEAMGLEPPTAEGR